jgi:hypothetical protein
MHVYSQALNLAAGQPMGGYLGERLSASPSLNLEVNGWQFEDADSGMSIELCSLDALYAGDLVTRSLQTGGQRIFAASHTHFAPMLDGSKPQIGALAPLALDEYERAVREATRRRVQPTACRIFRAQVSIPVYRRFDVPNSALNRWLTAHAGMYPNPHQVIDRHLYLFEFSQADGTTFVLCYHACHPVSRHDRTELSSDYVGAIRRTVRERFGDVSCLFLLGCAGDIRPNFSRKRISWLPRSRFNWRFEWPVESRSERAADAAYRSAVLQAEPWQELALEQQPCSLKSVSLPLKGLPGLSFPSLRVGKRLRFDFVPFEVSHLYHLEAQQKDPMHFIVSCADQTLGYLPHPRQLPAGGYEVDASRACMNLPQRTEWLASRPW